MGRFFLNFTLSLSLLWMSAVAVAEQPNPLTADSTYKVAGLSLPAEIIVDEWGVPHIYANDHYDVFFVQGFNAARDRLWQIDTWRRRGLGQLSEVFGADYVAQDRAARMFLYRKDMYSEWLAYGNDAKRITESFVAGINAFVKVAQQNPDLMPPEFALLGYAPSIWQPEDVVRIRSNGLWRNVVTEVWRARLACKDQLEEAAQWKVLEPSWEAKVPKGLDPCVIPDDVLDNYLLAKAPVKFLADPKRQTLAQAVVDAHRLDVGSNNWVVAGDRTTTGRPILADDPHRGHAVPSLRYIAHLNGPGIDVIGAGEPALPGISIGHNERIAFGLTIFPIDQEDLYVYRKAKNGYRYQNGVEPFTRVTEIIKVKGAPSQSVELLFSRHGPIVSQTKKYAFAVRAAWLEPGMSPYFGSIEYMRAQNFREFVGALNRWGAPSENQVYADTDGNIGDKPAGRFPKRDNWDGLLPVPGDGSYEWDGYFDMDVLPEEYNPERGFSGTANAMSLPDDYPIETYKVGFEWSAPWRYRRLWEVLEADDEHSMEDSLALQRDYESVFARAVLAQVPVLLSRKVEPSQLLADWDHKLTTDSPAAALWNVWYYRHLGPALSETLSKDPGTVSPRIDTQTVLKMLTTEQGQTIASDTLKTAWKETKDLLGDEPGDWQWGDLHKIKFSHPLLSLAGGDLKAQMTIPEYPRGGSENTTNNTGYNPDNFLVRSGASFRMVLDVGNWDDAKMTNAPGQSGNPGSPYYDNLLKNWATDSHLPMVYSRARVEAHKAFTITLEPEE
ncbi:MAG: penicillin acylase family protein [Gammaproteobacteria bacterium]|nr:penicillin acylase family protein [Gammaproteobacteria bacterium]